MACSGAVCEISMHSKQKFCSLVLLLALACGLARANGIKAQTSAATSAWGDDRFGVFLTGDPEQLLTIGARWFISPGDTSRDLALPPGAVWVQQVDFHGDEAIPAG